MVVWAYCFETTWISSFVVNTPSYWRIVPMWKSPNGYIFVLLVFKH